MDRTRLLAFLRSHFILIILGSVVAIGMIRSYTPGFSSDQLRRVSLGGFVLLGFETLADFFNLSGEVRTQVVTYGMSGIVFLLGVQVVLNSSGPRRLTGLLIMGIALFPIALHYLGIN